MRHNSKNSGFTAWTEILLSIINTMYDRIQNASCDIGYYSLLL